MSFIPLTKRNTETRRRGLKQLSHQTHTHAAVRHQIVSPDRAVNDFRVPAPKLGGSTLRTTGGREQSRAPVQILPFFSMALQRDGRAVAGNKLLVEDNKSRAPMVSFTSKVYGSASDPHDIPIAMKERHIDDSFRTSSQIDFGSPTHLKACDQYQQVLLQSRRKEIPRGRRVGPLHEFQKSQALWDRAGNSYGNAPSNFKR